MTDELIIEKLRTFDEGITREYFYGYCRKAYNIFDLRYQLRYKTGLDFFSLAHEYYIYLLIHEFKPLLDKPAEQKLSSWMIKGFHFVVLDALKAYNKEFEHQAVEVSDAVLDYLRSTDHEENMMLQITDAVAYHYKNRTMEEIARSIFYLGFKQKDVAEQLGLTPAAVNQRYKKMMDEVVVPFVVENYGSGICTEPIVCQEMIEIKASMVAGLKMSERYNRHSPSYNNDHVTPPMVTTLGPNEIFVFGSNLQGIHVGGAARMAKEKFGAEPGKGVGLQGRSYAIPTMQGGVESIRPYVEEFLSYAAQHPEQHFLVTPIGCGLAGFEADDIAPLFRSARGAQNISLPIRFWEEL